MKQVFCFLLFIGIAFGQNYVHTFYAPDVSLRPGEVKLSPNKLTSLEFEGLIEGWVSGQGALFDIQEGGTELILTTGELGGETDLRVTVGGRRMMFTLIVDSEEIIGRRYIIKNARPRSNITALGSALSAPEVAVQTSAPVPAPVASPVAAPAPSVQVVQAASPAPAAAIDVGQLDLSSGGFNEDGYYYVHFNYINTSPYRVALIPSYISASQGEQSLTVAKVEKEPLRNLVDPGASQRGLIVLSGAQVGEVDITWSVMAMTTSGGLRNDVQASLNP